MSTGRDDQPKKVHNEFRPPKTNVACRQDRLGTAKKHMFGPNLAPIQRIFDLADAFFSRRHAGHDLGVENNRNGLKRFYVHPFLLGVCISSPRIEIRRAFGPGRARSSASLAVF